jgi:hypothetical protein
MQDSLLLYSESCMHAPIRPHRVRLKHRVLQGDVRILMTVIAGFAGDQGDAPCVGPAVHQHTLGMQAGPAAAFGILDSGRLPPRYAPSAQLAIEVIGLGDAPFDVLLDDVGFSHDSAAVFLSGFD